MFCYEVGMVPAVRVVILNFNGGDDVVRCVDHVLATQWPKDRLEVIVVDNASSDGSARRIERRFPDVHVLHHAINTGFPANNLAMRDLDDVAYVALVNPDAFVEPDWLAPLVAALEADGELGAACPRILLDSQFVEVPIAAEAHTVPNDTRDLGVRVSGVRVNGSDLIDRLLPLEGVWGAESDGGGGRYHWTASDAVLGIPVSSNGSTSPIIELRLDCSEAKTAVVGSTTVAVDADPRWTPVNSTTKPYDVINNAGSILVEGGWGADRGLGERDDGQYDEPCDVFAWCGGGVLLRSDYLRDVGLFDEDFFLYYEDTDLSWRGQGRGWRYRYVPAARIRHLHGASTVIGSPLFVYNVERNRLLMLVKNAPAGFVVKALVAYLRSTLGIARMQVVGPLRRRRRPDLRTTWLRLRAFLGVIRALPATWDKRRAIRRSMRVGDEDLLRWQVPQP